MAYIALILAFTLACVAGLQFFYMMFIQAALRQEKRRVVELETQLRRTRQRLEMTGRQLQAVQQQLDEARGEVPDVWPEIIDS